MFEFNELTTEKQLIIINFFNQNSCLKESLVLGILFGQTPRVYNKLLSIILMMFIKELL